MDAFFSFFPYFVKVLYSSIWREGMNILGHYYLSFEIIISVSSFCEIGFSFLPTASSVCHLIARSHTFCYRVYNLWYQHNYYHERKYPSFELGIFNFFITSFIFILLLFTIFCISVTQCDTLLGEIRYPAWYVTWWGTLLGVVRYSARCVTRWGTLLGVVRYSARCVTRWGTLLGEVRYSVRCVTRCGTLLGEVRYSVRYVTR